MLRQSLVLSRYVFYRKINRYQWDPFIIRPWSPSVQIPLHLRTSTPFVYPNHNGIRTTERHGFFIILYGLLYLWVPFNYSSMAITEDLAIREIEPEKTHSTTQLLLVIIKQSFEIIVQPKIRWSFSSDIFVPYYKITNIKKQYSFSNLSS